MKKTMTRYNFAIKNNNNYMKDIINYDDKDVYK